MQSSLLKGTFDIAIASDRQRIKTDEQAGSQKRIAMPVSRFSTILIALIASAVCFGDTPSSNGQGISWSAQVPANPQLSPDYLKELYDSQNEPELKETSNSELVAAASKIGLNGRWIVTDVTVDGKFSDAQIGQQPNDVISIVPGKDNNSPLALG